MNKLTGLVLQGGGALGAYQYGAIAALEEMSQQTTRKEWMPDVVSGVSIGAVNACVFLGGKAGGVQSLEILWEKLKYLPNPFLPQTWQSKASKIGVPNMFKMNPLFFLNPFTAKSKYDLSPFRDLLLEIVDFDKLNNHPTELTIKAVNVKTGKLKRFSNHREGGITVDKIMACISIPPNFAHVEVDGDYYWDGGLHDNMPLKPVLEYFNSNGDSTTQRDMVIMSLFSSESPLPSNMQDTMDRMFGIIFDSKVELSPAMFESINQEISFNQKLDDMIPQDAPIRQDPYFQERIQKKKIDHFALLQYTGEGVAETDNFIPSAIDARYQKGYNDAMKRAKNMTKLSNQVGLVQTAS